MQAYLADISRQMFLLIIFLIGALVFAALCSYIAIPKYKSYSANDKSFTTLNNASKDSGNYTTEMNSIQAQIQELQKRLNGERVHLPSRQFESHVIGQLQHLAWRNNVELAGVRPRTGKMVDRYREVLFDVNLAGDYFDLYRLLSDFKQALGFVVINDFHISPLDTKKQTPWLKVKMSIVSYRAERS